MSDNLTPAEMATLSFALSCALEERDSFADSYGRDEPEAIKAREACERIEALHVRVFGRPSAFAQRRAEEAESPTVSIFSLMAGNPAKKGLS